MALDSITDPRNLGAVVRSAAAFGAHGVLIPERRAAGMTAAAWKTSAGAAARLPVARATNLNRTLRAYADAGLHPRRAWTARPTSTSPTAEGVTGPLVLVVGSEGDGLSRLVREACDTLASIPITADGRVAQRRRRRGHRAVRDRPPAPVPDPHRSRRRGVPTERSRGSGRRGGHV